MTLAILFSLKTTVSLENSLQPYSGVTPLFPMNTVLLVSPQSCHSVGVDAWCKWAFKYGLWPQNGCSFVFKVFIIFIWSSFSILQIHLVQDTSIQIKNMKAQDGLMDPVWHSSFLAFREITITSPWNASYLTTESYRTNSSWYFMQLHEENNRP